jgi:hypothetical protein
MLPRRVISIFDLPPLQGASLWVAFPGLKPWAESSSPFGANSADAHEVRRGRLTYLANVTLY